jgi:hypothetical protein
MFIAAGVRFPAMIARAATPAESFQEGKSGNTRDACLLETVEGSRYCARQALDCGQQRAGAVG